MKAFRTILCAALLVAGLCGCEKDDVVRTDLLEGVWDKVYPEGVATEGFVRWTFQKGDDPSIYGNLNVTVSDVFTGDHTENYLFCVTTIPTFINGLEVDSLSSYPKLEVVGPGENRPVLAVYDILKCDRKQLVLKYIGFFKESDPSLDQDITLKRQSK